MKKKKVQSKLTIEKMTIVKFDNYHGRFNQQVQFDLQN